MMSRAILLLAFLCATATGQINITGVTSAAGFKPGMTEWGGLNSVFCTGLTGIDGIITASGSPLPRTLAGVQVFVNGEAAPLLAVANAGAYQQINFQNVGLAFTPPGTNPDVIRVIQTRLGIPTSAEFTPARSSGVFFEYEDGSAIVQRPADNTLISGSNPARPGDVLVAYTTGLGPTVPNATPGEPAPVDPLARLPQNPDSDTYSLTVGDHAAEVFYAGLTPGYVGLYQINFRLPAGLPSGDADLVFERRQWVTSVVRSAPSKLHVR